MNDFLNGEWTHLPSKRNLSDSSDQRSPDPTINEYKRLFVTENRYEVLQS